MFVVMALVTTVATTPLTKALYPPWYQKKVERWRRGEIDWDGNPINQSEHGQGDPQKKPVEFQIRRLLVHLRLDSLPSLFTFITLLSPESVPVSAHPDAAEESSKANEEVQIRKRPLEVHGLRVIELTDRTSSVMHLTEGEDFYSLRDPVVNAFRTFSQLHDVAVSGRVAVVPADSYAETLMTKASEVSSDFALIPWGEYGSVSEDLSFPVAMSASERFRSSTHLEFINQTFQKAAHTCNTGIFIDNGFGGITKPVGRPELIRTRSALSIRSHTAELASLPVANKSHHIFLPFFGGADDRVAMRIVLQLAKNQNVTASIVRITWRAAKAEEGAETRTQATSSHGTETPDPKAAADDPFARQEQEDADFFSTMQASLPADLSSRVMFSETEISSAASALTETVVLAQKTVGLQPKNAGDVVVLGRRNTRFGDVAVEAGGSSPDLKRTVGAVAEQLVTTGIKASILVVQAGGRNGKGLDIYA
jgi:hypothetical protein